MESRENKNDTISEEAFTRGMAKASTLPQYDSPEDSTKDERSEALMGVGYSPSLDISLEDPIEDRELRVTAARRRLFQTVTHKTT
jgi:hypothetical protein